MVNVQFGRIRKLCIVIRAGPVPRLSRTSTVDNDTLTITFQHKLTAIISLSALGSIFEMVIDIPSITGAGDGDPMGKQSAIVIAAGAGDGDYEVAEGSSGAII